MSTSRWLTGGGASVVLVLTGLWAAGPGRIDRHLWGEVRPVIEARLVADERGSGYGETVPALRAVVPRGRAAGPRGAGRRRTPSPRPARRPP
ncbi:hypothetical protein [Streptomyces collinus]|uniref:hypothetical protein n=1 Tax=Streptomyces collinus TaxID=42684 RepID=UPI0036EC6710